MKRGVRLRLDADVVVHGSANPLLAAEIAFRCLHGNVAEKELDLFQFSTRSMHSFAHERLRSWGATWASPSFLA